MPVRGGFKAGSTNTKLLERNASHRTLTDGKRQRVIKIPGQAIIVDHVGGHLGVLRNTAGKQAETLPVWQKNMQDLSRCPNVVVKLGGLGMISFGFDFHGARRRPRRSWPRHGALHRGLHRRLRPDRCMFESNFPVDKQSCSYTSCGTPSSASPRAPRTRKSALYGGTAARVYRMIKP